MKTEALVAGHICLDIIPELKGRIEFEPGRLIEAGPATLSTGGAVSNTGLTLTKLGVRTRLVGKVGPGPFGTAIRDILDSHRSGLGDSMAQGDETSYTIVVNLSGEDRMFLHSPGCNATFCAADVTDEALRDTRLMHFGYPPLMARMYADDGAELVALFRRAKTFGVLTSLDMSLPDPGTASGGANWERILDRVLPYVDLFVPSVEELTYMLDRPALDARGKDWPSEHFSSLAERVLGRGAKAVLIKAGEQGLYLKTTGDLGLGAAWNHRELWAPSYEVAVTGATGAGDAAIGGFLMGVLRGMSPERALSAGAAVGASCCEAADAVSGVRDWETTSRRIESGWRRREIRLGNEWKMGNEGAWERNLETK